MPSMREPVMPRATIAAGAFAATLVLFALVAGYRVLEHDVDAAVVVTRLLHERLDGPLEQDVDSAAANSLAMAASTAAAHEGLLHGRVTTEDGAVYKGRLRFGGDEEALWGDYFNGFKDDNPWVAHVPADRRPKERVPIEIFGVEIADRERQLDLGRPFMARFGDIARIEGRGRDLRVTLKSGTEFVLDRFSADDFADGVRVWDERLGVVDLGEWEIRKIEFLPPRLGLAGAGHPDGPAGDAATPFPLYGTVRTRHGAFTGFVQWDREECLGLDELDGRTADGELSLRFDTIRSIARRGRDSSLVTLLDGRSIVLSGARDVGRGNRGIYVNDPRYGRVLVSWDAFERVDFSPGGTGPAYGDFPPGRPLTGSVVTRSGGRIAGRLVHDLDDTATTETLDAPWQGVDYTIPVGLVASIVLPDLEIEGRGARRAMVTLHSGEELQLELSGDLGESSAGMLVFVDGHQRPEYVPWVDVEQVDFDRPPEMYPPDPR